MLLLVFQRVAVLRAGRAPGPVQGDDEGQPDGYFRRGDGQDEDRQGLSCLLYTSKSRMETALFSRFFRHEHSGEIHETGGEPQAFTATGIAYPEGRPMMWSSICLLSFNAAD